MKILDRYIIGQFLKNYLLSFCVLVGLYVVLDMVFNFDELLEAQAQPGRPGIEVVAGMLRDAADYYGYQVFLYFVQLSGIIPVVASAFTLMRLSHNNELSAMMSAGVPLLRVAAPMILVAVVLNFLVLADQELVIPHMIPKLVRKHDEIRDAEKNSFPIRAMQDSRAGLLVAGRYYPAATQPTMKGFSLVTPPGPDRKTSLVTADLAHWDGRRWQLVNQDGSPGTLVREEAGGRVTKTALAEYQSNITPDEIRLYRSGEFVELLSTQRINELLARPHTFARADLVRTKHFRFTQLAVNIILLLLAIACILTREPQQLRTAAARCLVLCGVCMTVVFIAQQMAGQPPGGPNANANDTWPALMAWVPIFIFAPLSAWLLDRVKT